LTSILADLTIAAEFKATYNFNSADDKIQFTMEASLNVLQILINGNPGKITIEQIELHHRKPKKSKQHGDNTNKPFESIP